MWWSWNQMTHKARHIPVQSRLGQIIQTEWSFLPEVFQLICKRWHLPQSRPVCYEVPKQATSVCLTSSRPGSICLPTSSHSGQSGGETKGLPMQEDHSDYSRMAQHALVLGSGSHVQLDPSVPAQSADSAIQSDSTQESVEPKSPCLAHRAPAIKEQGFSVRQWQHKLRLLKESQPNQSMKQSGPFLQGSATVIRWTSGHHL